MEISQLHQLYLDHPKVQTDTRKIAKGEIFFALKGENFNGNTFAIKALELGAAYVVIDESEYNDINDDRYILVDNVLDTLQALARYHRLQLDIPVLAITGSNGKTTTKELLVAVLQQQYNVYATAGNLNNHIGIPLTLLSIPLTAEIAVIEMGANHIGEIASYCTIALPNYAIINNVGKAHLEGFGSLEGVKKAKGELYDFIRNTEGTIFRNNDLDYLVTMAQGIPNQITYGTANAQIIGRSIESDTMLRVVILSTGLETEIQTQLVGNYNTPNVLAAVTVGNYFKIPIETIKKAIEQYQPSNSRSQLLQKGSNHIILDAYNANPTSMRLAVENFAALSHNNKWLLIGAMKEMGTESATEHQTLVNLISQLGFQQVILTGKEYQHITHAFLHFSDATQVAQYLKKHPIQEAYILIKGSRGSKMELTLDAL
jgi:UDP-N-acetylmuramoyl-tripeptide--D-alanyl-D-alanine ligase